MGASIARTRLQAQTTVISGRPCWLIGSTADFTLTGRPLSPPLCSSLAACLRQAWQFAAYPLNVQWSLTRSGLKHPD
jgi:hypothetical protein